jgi:hypothetical protein
MLQIEELTLHALGFDQAEAHQLSQEVAQYLVDRLPADYRYNTLDALSLRVTIPPGTTRSQVAKSIAEAILRGLV